MKTASIHRVLAILLLLITIAPITIQAGHAFEKHEHKVCQAVDVKHIHEQNIDCTFFHFQIQQDSVDFYTSYDYINFQYPSKNFTPYLSSKYHIYLISESSRGLPYFIVS